MKQIMGVAVPALALVLLAGCTDVNLVQPNGTSITGIGGFSGDRWAIIRYVDKGSDEILAERREKADSLMRSYCFPNGFLVFERERTGDTGRVRMKFRCEGRAASGGRAGG